MSDSSKKTKLLVEDEAIIALSKKVALEKAGYSDRTANTGEKGMKATNATAAIEKALRKSEEKYRFLVENSHDIIYTLSADGTFLFVSPAWTTLLGHPLNQVIGESFQKFVHPNDIADCLAWLNQVIGTGCRQEGIEYRARHVDGSWFWHTSSAVPLKDETGKTIGFEGISRDITGRKAAEDKIKALLAEKEIILKEVHHRIKNNLNTISSLLSLQAGTLSEPSAITALGDAGNRIRSISLLYDQLYRSTDFIELSVSDYLPRMIDDTISIFPNSTIVKIEKRIEDFVLDTKRLQSLGIIINELLTNSMKYAFKGRASGLVNVGVNKADEKITLIVGDNGIGLPEDISFDNTSGFGLQLVQTLVQQLNGTIRIERLNGTKYIVQFGLSARE